MIHTLVLPKGQAKSTIAAQKAFWKLQNLSYYNKQQQQQKSVFLCLWHMRKWGSLLIWEAARKTRPTFGYYDWWCQCWHYFAGKTETGVLGSNLVSISQLDSALAWLYLRNFIVRLEKSKYLHSKEYAHRIFDTL